MYFSRSYLKLKREKEREKKRELIKNSKILTWKKWQTQKKGTLNENTHTKKMLLYIYLNLLMHNYNGNLIFGLSFRFFLFSSA